MKSNEFIITALDIINFRGYTKKKFNFVNSKNEIAKFILLSGPNGYGKTTVIDAIEWCFTGSIYRIKKEFELRCKKTGERNQISQNIGLLRNSQYVNQECKVIIYAKYCDKEIKIIRTYDGEKDFNGINGESTLTLECEKDIDSNIRNFLVQLEKRFYDRNICTYDKNIELYNKGRTDIYNMFSGLFSEFGECKKIVENMETIKEFAKEKISKSETELSNIKYKLELLEQSCKEKELKSDIYYSEELKEKFDEIKKMPIKEIMVYKENIKKENEILNLQYYKIIELKLEEYCEHLNKLHNIKTVNELINIIKNNPNIVKGYGKIDFSEIKVHKLILENYKKTLETLDSLEISKDNLEKLKLNPTKLEFIFNEITHFSNIEKENIKTISNLESQLNKYNTNSKLINSIRAIVDNIEGYVEYKDESNICPLCGKGGYKESDIAKNAKEFLGESDSIRNNLVDNINSIKLINSSNLKKIINIINEEINKEIDEISNILKDESLIETCKDLLKQINIDELNLVIIEQMQQLLNNEIRLFNEIQYIDIINNLEIELLDKFNLRDISLKSLDDKKHGLKNFLVYLSKIDNNEIEIKDEDLDSIKSKKVYKKEIINSIDFIINNNEIIKLSTDKGKCEKELKVLIEGNKKVDKIIKKINGIIKTFEEKETQRIVKPLDSFYRKITRSSTISKIYIDRGKLKDGLELMTIDNVGNKNMFANILSTGQMSTLAISIFLSRALLDKDINIPIYMMDDPIQSMDDLNILSFIDILRFELSNDNEGRSFINQIIFSTCNKDLELLITHKMKSFDVKFKSFEFIDLALCE